jgi:hypothetical protein
VAISDPATAHVTAIKNLGNKSIAYKPRKGVCGCACALVCMQFLCFLGFSCAVKCAVAGSLIATGVSCSVVSNWPLCEFCGRVYCDLLSIFLILQFLRYQTMDKVQKYNSFNTNTPSSESYRNYYQINKYDIGWASSTHRRDKKIRNSGRETRREVTGRKTEV